MRDVGQTVVQTVKMKVSHRTERSENDVDGIRFDGTRGYPIILRIDLRNEDENKDVNRYLSLKKKFHYLVHWGDGLREFTEE